MEGSHFIQTGKLVKLSEQQLVDCSRIYPDVNDGCDGGLEVLAFNYAINNALELEADYPYKAKTGKKCLAKKSIEKVGVKSYVRVPNDSVAQLKAAVDKQPTCVSVDASGHTFSTYTKGIMNSKKCGTNLDHAVTAVGYGKEGNNEYLIVRNSWTASWGEEGYFRIAINADGDGICGILMDSSRPTTTTDMY